MKYYSHNKNEPAPLPFRVHMPSGTTRTDPTTFTDAEISAAGYVLADPMPDYDSATQHRPVWTGERWQITDMTEDEIARLALLNEAEDSRQSELTDAQAQYAAFCLSLGFDKPEDFDLLYGALQKLRETREPVPLPTPEEMLAQRKAYLETDEGWATIEPSMDVITRMLEIVSEAQLSRPPMNNLDAIQLFRERETELSTTEQKLTMAMLAQELQQLRVILVDEDGLLWNDVLMVGQIQAGGQAPPESEDADADGIPDNPQSLWSRVWGWIAGR